MISFKTELKLNNKQRTIMAKHAGVARHAYNWGLAICKEILDYRESRKISCLVRRSLKITQKIINLHFFEIIGVKITLTSLIFGVIYLFFGILKTIILWLRFKKDKTFHIICQIS
jgi:hypothetical protein